MEKEQQYEITVVGEYIRGQRRDVSKKTFEEKFVLDCKDGEALSIIQNNLIKPRLLKADPEFKHVRKVKILNQKPLAPGKAKKLTVSDLPSMSIEDLAQFAASQKLKIDVTRYSNLDEARKAIKLALDDKQLAAKVQKQKPKSAAGKPVKSEAADAGADADDEFDDVE